MFIFYVGFRAYEASERWNRIHVMYSVRTKQWDFKSLYPTLLGTGLLSEERLRSKGPKPKKAKGSGNHCVQLWNRPFENRDLERQFLSQFINLKGIACFL